MKMNRHKAIIDIIEQNAVANQDVLLSLLKNDGFDVTQATVSRDIKTLDLIKAVDHDGNYRYARRQTQAAKSDGGRFKAVFIEAVISVDYAMNTVVIKCHVGMANAACATLDTMNLGDVVGTLAGDDTIFVLLRSENSASEFVKKIHTLLA